MQPDDTAPTRRQQPAGDPAPSVDRTEATRKSPAGGAAPPSPAPAHAQAPGDLTGQVLSGKYRVVRLLGKGGFGAVYEAKDEMLGASVAVKVLTPAAAEQDDALQQFLGEARLLTSLDHPNIVRWITFDRTASGLHYFVMEILKGSELSDVLDDVGQMPHQRVTTILLQVLSALRAAHFLPDGRSLLHLDLKPRNVFVVKGEPEQIKVIDFGISQHVGAAARSAAGIGPETAVVKKDADLGATIATISSAADKSWMISQNGVNRARGGTLLYASPEQCKHLRGDPIIDQLDGRSDLYSLGVMAFQMLTGKMPWECRTQKEAFKAHLETPAPPLSKFGVKVPRGLEQFVTKCLAKKREDRFADVKDAYDALHRVANPPSQWPKFVAAGALVAGLAVWQMWPEGSLPEVILPQNVIFFGPQQTTAQLSLGNLSRELASQTAHWVVDPQDDTPALPGWNVTVAIENGTPLARLSAPADLTTIVDTQAYLRFGAGAMQQHSEPVRLVWLPADACSIGEIGVRGAGARVIDPVGAKLAIDIRTKRDYIDPARSVQVALGDQVRNARLDEGTPAATLLFEVALDDFGFTPDDGERTADFQIVVHDRAGNEQRRPAALRVDARQLTFAANLDVPADTKDFYVLDPKAEPTLRWQSHRTPVVELVARDLQNNLVAITTEPVADGIRLRLPAAKEPYQAALQIRANDLGRVYHVDDRRGRNSAELRYRYETKGVTVGVRQRHADGSVPARGTADRTFLTNRDAITLDLTREQVAVSVEVECRSGGATPWTGKADLHGEGFKSLAVPLGPDGRYDVAVRGYRYSGPNVPRTSTPEYEQAFVVLRDTKAPALRLLTPPAQIAGDVDATTACFSIEVGDDSTEPLSLEWVLNGPSPATGRRLLEAGPVRSLAIAWQQLEAVDPQQLEDGDYTLQLTAMDAAANRSTMATSEPFVVARHGPLLLLDKPRSSSWLAKSGNRFEVIIKASDNNGVETVECAARAIDQDVGTISFAMRRAAGSDPTNSDWVGEAALPPAWSQQQVQVIWSGSDRFGVKGGEQSFSTTLPSFEVPQAPRVWPQITGTSASVQSMRLVKGDPNYVFGGRNEDDELDLLASFGLEGSRAKIGKCAAERTRVDDYYLDESEVSVRQFRDFLVAGYQAREFWTTRDGRGELGSPTDERLAELRRLVAAADPGLPITQIDWYEAAAYAQWVGKRLPTKVEWEYAVRGGTAYRPFSCAQPGKDIAKMNVDGADRGPRNTNSDGDTTPAGRGEGIRNLCSNVMEWTASASDDPARMQTVGACFEDLAFHFRRMTPLPPTERRGTIGFRCAASASDIHALAERPGRVQIQTTEPAPDLEAR